MKIHTHSDLKNYCLSYRLWDKPPKIIEDQIEEKQKKIKDLKQQTYHHGCKYNNWQPLNLLKEIHILFLRGEIAMEDIDHDIQWAMSSPIYDFEIQPIHLGGDLSRWLYNFKNLANGNGKIERLDEISVMASQSWIDYFQGGSLVREKCESNGRPIPYKYRLQDARINEKHIRQLVYRLEKLSYEAESEEAEGVKYRIDKIINSIDLTSKQLSFQT